MCVHEFLLIGEKSVVHLVACAKGCATQTQRIYDMRNIPPKYAQVQIYKMPIH